jgi:predicted RNA-binding Zn-ribbon protein involved in translation (DUF1610 family)
MSMDDLEEYIRQQAQKPTTISAEDLEPPVCAQCGEQLKSETEVVLWDIPEHGNTDVVWRYRLCSDECKTGAMYAEAGNMLQHSSGE